jgi:hypothetical protein
MLHLDAWVIQDGNYADMSVGTLFESALEFEAVEIAAAGESAPTVHRANADYAVSGELKYVWRRVWVLNFGLRAYAERLEWDRDEHWLAGTVRLRLDAFSFREGLASLPGIPAMTYKWSVTGLWRLLPPHPPPAVGDDPELEAIERTNAMTDDEGHASYLLRCEKLARP